MLASVLTIAICSALLLYWFRYTCLLMLRNLSTQPVSAVSGIQGFSFAKVQERLQSDAALDPLHAMLQRDYQVLTYLVRHASGLKLDSFEEKLLMWDYRAMQVWYAVTRVAAPQQALPPRYTRSAASPYFCLTTSFMFASSISCLLFTQVNDVPRSYSLTSSAAFRVEKLK